MHDRATTVCVVCTQNTIKPRYEVDSRNSEMLRHLSSSSVSSAASVISLLRLLWTIASLPFIYKPLVTRLITSFKVNFYWSTPEILSMSSSNSHALTQKQLYISSILSVCVLSCIILQCLTYVLLYMLTVVVLAFLEHSTCLLSY